MQYSTSENNNLQKFVNGIVAFLRCGIVLNILGFHHNVTFNRIFKFNANYLIFPGKYKW